MSSYSIEESLVASVRMHKKHRSDDESGDDTNSAGICEAISSLWEKCAFMYRIMKDFPRSS